MSLIQTLTRGIKKGRILLMQSPTPSFPPLMSRRLSPKIHWRGSISSTHRRRWRGRHCNSFSTSRDKRTSSQHNSLSGWVYWPNHTCNHTPSGGSNKDNSFASTNNVAFPTTSNLNFPSQIYLLLQAPQGKCERSATTSKFHLRKCGLQNEHVLTFLRRTRLPRTHYTTYDDQILSWNWIFSDLTPKHTQKKTCMWLWGTNHTNKPRFPLLWPKFFN